MPAGTARKNAGNPLAWLPRKKKRRPMINLDRIEHIISLHRDGLTSQEILDVISGRTL